jgi:chromosome segregation ATPase
VGDVASLVTILTGAGGLGLFGLVLWILLRQLGDTRAMLAEADTRYRVEAKDHEQTQTKLDREREQRRGVEQKLHETRGELIALQRQVQALAAEVARLTGGARGEPSP